VEARVVDGEESLRERKRRQTRAVIADAAMGLFEQRGFDRVSVAEAAAAGRLRPETGIDQPPAVGHRL